MCVTYHFCNQVRVFVLLGSIARNGDERLRYALIASSYVELQWAKTLRAVNVVAAERSFFSMSEGDRKAIDESTGYDSWLESQVRNLVPRLSESTVFTIQRDVCRLRRVHTVYLPPPWSGSHSGRALRRPFRVLTSSEAILETSYQQHQ